MELTYTVTLRVDPAAGETIEEAYRDDANQAMFATQMLADRLAVMDHRPFAESAYSKLAVWATKIEMGGGVTHEQPPSDGQVQAEESLALGFTSEQIAAARVDTPPAAVVD